MLTRQLSFFLLFTLLAGCGGMPPAYKAASRGDIDKLQKVISSESNAIHESTKRGSTPLHIAAQNNHPDAVSLLLAAGAEPNAVDSFGDTPLILASWRGNTDIVRMLLQRNADPNVVNVKNCSSLNVVPDDDVTDIISALLDAGADVTPPTCLGKTALQRQGSRGNVDTIRLLLDHGAPKSPRSETGDTAFMYAVANGHADAMPLLLDSTDIGTSNKAGDTALLLAIKNGYPALVPQLLDIGENAETLDGDGLVPLYFVSQYGFAAAAESLLGAGADAKWQHDDGRSPILAAAYGGHEEVIALLLESGAEPVAQTDFQEDVFATGITHLVWGDLQTGNDDPQAAHHAYSIAAESLGNVATQYEETSTEYGKRARKSAFWDAMAQGVAEGIHGYATQKQAQAQGRQMAQIAALSNAKTQNQYFALNKSYQRAFENAAVASASAPAYSDPIESSETRVLKEGQIVYAKRAIRARSLARKAGYKLRCAEAGRTDIDACVSAVKSGQSP